MSGTILMYGLMIITVLLPVALFNNITFVTFAPFYTLLFLIMTTYAIIKHRFLDIRLIVARSVAYFLFIFIVFLFITFSLSVIGNVFTGIQFNLSNLIISVTLALTVAFSFKRIEGLFERI